MDIAITVCLLIVGLINFVPIAGVLGASRIETAYAVELPGSDLQILMRHRALLFGVLGGFILYSAFNPTFQVAAMAMAAISMVGFAALVLAADAYNAQIRKVLIVDIVGIAVLLIAASLKFLA